MRPGTLGGPGLPDRVRIGECKIESKAVLEQDRWGHFISKAERSGDDLMEELQRKMEYKAKQYAPVRTGRLRRSIKARLFNHKRELRLGSDVPYTGVMEEGSRPHLIHGVRAKFDWRGGEFDWRDFRYGPVGSGRPYENWTRAYGATVRHPGTKPHRFFAQAFTETWQEARFIMRRVYGRR